MVVPAGAGRAVSARGVRKLYEFNRRARSRRRRQVGILWAPGRAAPKCSDQHMAVDIFNSALSQHRSGNLAEAERLYRQVVAGAPDHAGALHNLGMLAQARGHLQEAGELLARAAAGNPGDAVCHNNLGNVLRELGRSPEALAAYRAAVQTDPDYVNAYFNLASTLMDAGDAQTAADCYGRILSLAPDDREALGGLGIAMMTLGKPSQAIANFRRAVTLGPDDPVAHYNLATAYREEHLPDAALASYGRALAMDPGYAAAHNNVGMLLKAKGDLEPSARAFRAALSANPGHIPAHVNLISLLLEEKDAPAAEAQCRSALEIDPDSSGVLSNLGAALLELRRWQEAAESYRRVLALAANDLPAHLGLAGALMGSRQHDKAEQVLRRALEIDPEHARARCLLGDVLVTLEMLDEATDEYRSVDGYSTAFAYAQDGLGRALKKQGHMGSALAAYGRALAARPSFADTHSNSVFARNYATDISPMALLQEHRSWAHRHTSHLAPSATPVTGDRAGDSGRPLHVGYVSADFCRHSVAYFIEALIARRDHERFKVTCYANVAHPDDLSERIRTAADSWRDIRRLDDEAVAKLVIEDGIDILVDLSGHTAGNRLPVFARRPAPVQVSYLGYPNTTGLEQIDYRLTDELADPVGESDRLHSESLMRLATGFLCYSPTTDTPPVSEAPVLSNGFITFASFNNVTKVNESVVAAWAAILNGLPGSRLLLKSRQLADRGARRRLLELFSGHGVEPPRLELRGGLLTRSEHLETYARVDVALDPFPYNGTTTTCEALWMGVPVIALAGQVHRGRVGASILHYSGLDELLAQDVDAYVRKALALAGDGQALVALRQSLRQRMASSTLMDAEAAVRDLENAYGEMWRRHLASTPAGTPRDSNANDIARLNIGGTERRDGWKILNILPGPDVDYVGDCTDLTQLADASVADVYASHVLEHLGYGEDLASSLGHIHRILKPDGRLRVSVPDLDVLFRLYLNPDSDQSTRWQIMRIVYGGQVDKYDYHKLGFSWDSLSWYLRQIGFRNIRRVQEFGIFDDTSSLRIGGQLISLSVEARK